RARLSEYMLTNLADAEGDFDDLMRKILTRPRAESAATVERLHTRLVRCQVSTNDEALLRDQVIVAALVDGLGQTKPDPVVIDNLVGRMALGTGPGEPTAQTAWKAALARLAKVYPDKQRRFLERLTAAAAARRSPPPMLHKVSFCKAPDAPVDATQPE